MLPAPLSRVLRAFLHGRRGRASTAAPHFSHLHGGGCQRACPSRGSRPVCSPHSPASVKSSLWPGPALHCRLAHCLLHLQCAFSRCANPTTGRPRPCSLATSPAFGPQQYLMCTLVGSLAPPVSSTAGMTFIGPCTCLHPFHVAVAKYPARGTLERKEICLADSLRGQKSHTGQPHLFTALGCVTT